MLSHVAGSQSSKAGKASGDATGAGVGERIARHFLFFHSHSALNFLQARLFLFLVHTTDRGETVGVSPPVSPPSKSGSFSV